jgi:hypothetical protein
VLRARRLSCSSSFMLIAFHAFRASCSSCFMLFLFRALRVLCFSCFSSVRARALFSTRSLVGDASSRRVRLRPSVRPSVRSSRVRAKNTPATTLLTRRSRRASGGGRRTSSSSSTTRAFATFVHHATSSARTALTELDFRALAVDAESEGRVSV